MLKGGLAFDFSVSILLIGIDYIVKLSTIRCFLPFLPEEEESTCGKDLYVEF